MAYRFLILICLGLYASNQCLAMDREELKSPTLTSNRASDEVSSDEKVKWVETQSFNILAAEDSPITSLILKRFFTDANTIVVFSNGQELLNKIEACKSLPSFIITDGHMPVLDGWRTIEKLKTIENCPPIFALADSNEEERKRFLKLGVAAFVKKPVSKGTLFPVIYDVFHSLEKDQGQ